ncbi:MULTISPECIES: energy-coupling factor transporter transmembrane component T family protein [Brevibacillus]|jgi:energy-coupling factor transport system permease protein|uniref:energy-coupling factor transporter transmembrane component T family protein n=1 Tax=Brevibacillus TaxID=55080 RepID=UPI000EEA52A2|nr:MULTISPECIES: energy-coupling factor transporter transmembrane component T [Brevibacillus]MBU8712278.1 energy-coupling factor transporter transmembrane protein EcfT [Brevibacillus parabrevis]MDH6349349.1 energy-coupling factor transport system permease protein [Brevibacillus sp. 1238]MDR5001361.1 energy-coupling factor transporter transmembrane component T [Brevibacillus parabrevis]MED2257382.1 energy-coupling factor transporter transmembrane component T [Brevibacillus parabrevis]NRQ52375.1
MSAEFELTRNITIGQYLPTASVVHRLDPRFKLGAFAILIVAIAICNTYVGNLFALAVCLWLFQVSKIPLHYGISGIKPAIPFIIILAIMQLLFYGEIANGGTVYFQYGIISISSESIRLVIVSAMRFVEVIFLSSVLTLSTSTTELTHGMERLLGPLEKVKFPVHAFALIITIAIRFVPTFAMEMEKMMKAQASRGADFGTGEWWRIVQRTKDMFPIIIPLFNVALSRAEDLILAMEARCYMPGASRTRYTQYKAKGIDYAALVASVVISVVMLGIPW